ncbi:potassium channel subfamily K member 1-like [Oncorhynchus nerka]|uniref:potassium channel subfamily K member 1-like n=1 Tax=Oncorhynchus nerka TaxID=8023 RepID=UPI00113260A7|nr:potassium channel subfamily K member 1-like [Oncorhynchus nerka]
MYRQCASLVERHRSELSFALLLSGYALYLILGAWIFSAVELPYEQRLREQLETARQKFLWDNACVSDERLEELLTRALHANNYGVSVLGNASENNWDFISSLFFTSTVLTTTGYGHTVPLSDGGKAFCVFYSLLGIPVTLLFLSALVQRIMVLVTRRPVAYLHLRWGVSKPKFAAVHAACLSVVAALLLFLLPAVVFCRLEPLWSYLESLYFCFISLTTIGLGDYVPGETHNTIPNSHRTLYKLAITLYLLLGLVCLLVVVETCCELPQLKSFRRRFYRENNAPESETRDQEEFSSTEHDQMTDHLTDQLTFSSVSAQAASLRQDNTTWQ